MRYTASQIKQLDVDMVLAPREPTDAMLVAATEVNKTLNAEQIVILYRAMIATAEKEQKC